MAQSAKPPDTRLSEQIAQAILLGFDRHFKLFSEITRKAQTWFENRDWQAEAQARRERIDFYDKRVDEALTTLRDTFQLTELDQNLWQDVKRRYMWLLYEHRQPELAESFYNSVFCNLFDRQYFNNAHIFVKPGVAVNYLDMESPVYRSFYPNKETPAEVFQQLLQSFGLKRPWQNLARDCELLAGHFRPQLEPPPASESFVQLQVIRKLFFRNKAAYVIGRAQVGNDLHPFSIPILINQNGELTADALITDLNQLALIFSFTRAYFMVDTEVPSGIVQFLKTVLPSKSDADLYTAIGFHKQGKTLFYRDFLYHLQHSSDSFTIAPGIRGMVMCVFTLPSYPYVFKVIRDTFDAPKEITRDDVKAQYRRVKAHDRVGRLADTLEFSQVALPLARFDEALLEELQTSIAQSIKIENDMLIIRHVYIERRMQPLNLYIADADDEQLEQSIIGYGNAIKDLAAANIFPGDMLLKNFGLTRYGYVVFYDYDEICLMQDINIRAMPPPRSDLEALGAEPWFNINQNDFFPAQFRQFAIGGPRLKECFLHHHADLLEPETWKHMQQNARHYLQAQIFPYPQSERFINCYPERYAEGAE